MEAKKDIDQILNRASKWRQLAVCTAFFSISLIIGYEGGITMVQTGYLAEGVGGFLLSSHEISWLASVGPLAAMPGNILGGVVANLFGRKKGALVVCPLYAIGLGLSYIADPSTVYLLYISKLLCGFCMGFQFASCASYFTEVTTPQTRTSVHTIAGMWLYLGICQPLLLAAHGVDWQASSLLGTLYPTATFLCLCFVPESPVWLVAKGHVKEARAALIQLRGQSYEYEEELIYLEHANEMMTSQPSSSRWSWIHRLAEPEIWKPFLLVTLTFALQTWVGLNSLDRYIVLIFQASGTNLDKYTSTLVATGFRLSGQLCASILLVRYRRRPIFMASSGLIAVGMTGLGVSLLMNPASEELFESVNSGALNITPNTISDYEDDILTEISVLDFIPTFCIALVSFALCLGMAPIPWAYASELFPSDIRAHMSSIICSLVAAQAFIQIKTFPSMSESLGVGNTFIFFGCVACLSILWGAFFLPETKGKTILEISMHFNNSKKQETKLTKIEHRMNPAELKVLIS